MMWVILVWTKASQRLARFGGCISIASNAPSTARMRARSSLWSLLLLLLLLLSSTGHESLRNSAFAASCAAVAAASFAAAAVAAAAAAASANRCLNGSQRLGSGAGWRDGGERRRGQRGMEPPHPPPPPPPRSMPAAAAASAKRPNIRGGGGAAPAAADAASAAAASSARVGEDQLPGVRGIVPKDLGTDMDVEGADEGGMLGADFDATGADDAEILGVDEGRTMGSSTRALFQSAVRNDEGRGADDATGAEDAGDRVGTAGACFHAASMTPNAAGSHQNRPSSASSSPFKSCCSLLLKDLVPDMVPLAREYAGRSWVMDEGSVAALRSESRAGYGQRSLHRGQGGISTGKQAKQPQQQCATTSTST